MADSLPLLPHYWIYWDIPYLLDWVDIKWISNLSCIGQLSYDWLWPVVLSYPRDCWNRLLINYGLLPDWSGLHWHPPHLYLSYKISLLNLLRWLNPLLLKWPRILKGRPIKIINISRDMRARPLFLQGFLYIFGVLGLILELGGFGWSPRLKITVIERLFFSSKE